MGNGPPTLSKRNGAHSLCGICLITGPLTVLGLMHLHADDVTPHEGQLQRNKAQVGQRVSELEPCEVYLRIWRGR